MLLVRTIVPAHGVVVLAPSAIVSLHNDSVAPLYVDAVRVHGSIAQARVDAVPVSAVAALVRVDVVVAHGATGEVGRGLMILVAVEVKMQLRDRAHQALAVVAATTTDGLLIRRQPNTLLLRLPRRQVLPRSRKIILRRSRIQWSL